MDICADGTYSMGRSTLKGFMYGDALVSTAIIMFILPVILSVFWMATLTIYKAYYWDHIVQDTVTYLEESKSQYYKNRSHSRRDS